MTPTDLPIIAIDTPVLFEDEGQGESGDARTPAGPHRPSELPVIAVDMPVLFEDEGQEEMGDTRPHTTTEGILRYALMAHFAARPGHEVLANMNFYYHPTERVAYVSPDVMVVTPPAPLPRNLRWYRLGETGPAPVFAAEVLSRRTFQTGDLTLKPELYADFGIAEYLLLDVTGDFLPERLLLKVLDGGIWINRRDQGYGVVSRFGFRVVIDADGELRVLDEATGRPYPRPDEADAEARGREAEAAARQAESAARQAAEAQAAAAEARVRELEAELARLRGSPSPETK